MLTGPLEPTNEPHAIAKIAGIKMVEAYRSRFGCDFINVMQTNLYGRGDNYHPESRGRSTDPPVPGSKSFRRTERGGVGHRHAAARVPLCRRSRRRLHPFDEDSSDELVNISTGEDITIAEFARVVAATIGYAGEISFDTSTPDGTLRKLLDVSAWQNWAGAPAPRSRTASGSPQITSPGRVFHLCSL